MTVQHLHAHVYFSDDEFERARILCEAARDRFGLQMGRMHRVPVGPHPRGSCQLIVPVEQIGEVLLWLTLNRNGLTLFVHPETGNDLRDHSEHVIWLGPSETLNLDIFR